ncbi:hypothetical protein QA600_16360 [Natronococcus sp. A-GB1]|uniref:hypothetical protein n=1 Tax=Natronococcus sp. A-GB1 TaxID=3037648 RepID=UPI00241F53AD|nr:hypothetical protein [Natronococcus sp. A-GB1]MDG5760907.1 hypothetical protein [Natronococcus sp. A-GB1]
MAPLDSDRFDLEKRHLDSASLFLLGLSLMTLWFNFISTSLEDEITGSTLVGIGGFFLIYAGERTFKGRNVTFKGSWWSRAFALLLSVFCVLIAAGVLFRLIQ